MEFPDVCFLIHVIPFKKIYSHVTMVSLAGFQIVLLLQFLQFLVRPPIESTISFNLPSLGKGKYSDVALLEKMNRRIKITYYLTGAEERDNDVFNKVQLKTRELRANKDTLHAIQVHFSSTATYGEFVHLNSLMKIEEQPMYSLVGDDFYIWEEKERRFNL